MAPAVQDRLASWVCDLSLLHELTERLGRTSVLDDVLHEVLQAGATLVGAHRGAITLAPADGLGPDLTVGLGLRHHDLGALETVRYDTGGTGAGGTEAGRVRAGETGAGETGVGGAGAAGTGAGETGAGGAEDAACESVHRDLLHDAALGARHREVAAQLGIGAAYALRLASETDGRLGTAVWFYDEPAEPAEARRRLVGLYLRHAAEHLARCLGLARAERAAAALTAELLPARLPRVPGVRMAVRHATGPRGGGDWFDALPLPEGALGLAVGGVTGAGPGAVAAMGRLRASLRAYAVMEGEDPVAVLSDLELLLRLTEPARAATALFAYTSAPVPAGGGGGPSGGAVVGAGGSAGGDHGRRVTLAGAGHCPPLLVGDRRCEYVETSLSAPLNMLSCWEAPSVELIARPGESLLLYTDGLLHRTGESTDRAFARLHAAAQGAPRAVREDPERLADHVVDAVLPDGLDATDGAEDLVLLVARFD
ncbi:PP2C family protein-serine/threonine phosphatase [Actinacidiphila sp. DG2A-62]|uniref:PP2C family protein-serine/threonine phosphatase n=1 Tax=Actinacidiphila sp. DG2A-62 TaxID=3108821 RepID=UPI003FA37B72